MKKRMIRDIQACFQCIYCKEVEGLHSYHYICTKHNKYSGQIMIGSDQRKELDAMGKWFQECEVWEVVE